MKKATLYIVIIVILTSCNSIREQVIRKEVVAHLEIGQIIDTRGGLSKDLEVKTTPPLSTPLRVTIKEIAPLKKKATKLLKSKAIIDTLQPIRPDVYYELELIDDIKYIQQINNDKATLNFIKNTSSAGVITKISIITRNNQRLNTASNIFLKQAKDNTLYLEVHDSQNDISIVSFKEFQLLDYEVSTFCYGLNQKFQIQVMDVLEAGKKCDNSLKNRVQDFKEQKSLFDF
ncbi:hypothetical protein OD90_1437 [Dokdonia sp. Hel_I_53]|nr:hypothetical protein OD90_1437 [Dokdonia sp. Hel_I_53]